MIWTSERRPGGSRRPLAVLYFDNHTGDARWAPLQKGLADMMVTDLAGTPGLTVAERAHLRAAVQQMARAVCR